VSPHPLGERVDDDVRTECNRALQGRRAEGGIDHKRKPRLVSNGRHRLEVGHVQRRVAHGLAEEDLGFRRDGLCEVFRVAGIDEPDRDAELGEDVVELGVGASVEVVGGDDLVARAADVDDRVEDGAGARGESQCGGTPLDCRDALLEHVVGGVHQARVDVAKLPEAEEIGRVVGVAEDIRCGPVNRHGARQGGGIRLVAGVEAESFQVHGNFL